MDIQELEQILDIKFQHVLNPYTFFEENYPPSYRDVMSLEEEMVRTYHQQHVFVNEEDQIIGINLFDLEIDDDRLQDLLSRPIPHLQSLNLGKTGLTSFTFSERYPNLVCVDLNANEALTRIQFDSTPQKLTLLEANLCQIKEITFPSGMDQLQKIDLSRNTDLVSCTFEGPCPALEELDLSKNALISLQLPSGFKELKYLFLHDNQLASFSFQDSLPKIETLHLSNNQLRNLPDNILEIDHLQTLYLYNNPWDRIKDAVPSEERKNAKQSVFTYLKSIQDETQVAYLNEAKMILVGNGMVGKTSLRKTLISGKPTTVVRSVADEKEGQTQGVEVEPFPIKVDPPEESEQTGPINFVFNIWDFGGQGRYREIQQIFCSYKSLYLFVTSYDDELLRENFPEDYVSFEYWLNMVTAYGYDKETQLHSPIIPVINKIDKKTPLLKNAIFEYFPNIHQDIVRVSCSTGKNIDRLVDMIRDVDILQSISPDIFSNKRNIRWLRVKDELEQLVKEGKKYISYKEYEELCNKHELSKEEARTWIDMLSRVGKFIYFGQHPKLSNMVILEPDWIRRAMCTAIDDEKVNEAGRLDPYFAELIWRNTDDITYQEGEREKFIELMRQYKLCYPKKGPHNSIIYIVPACLQNQEPEDLPRDLNHPSFRIHIKFDPFIPAGTLNKLIVSIEDPQYNEEIAKDLNLNQFHKRRENISIFVYNECLWKNNVILHDSINGTFAHVKEDWNQNLIVIGLYKNEVGPDSLVRELYEYIERILERLNNEIKATKNIRKMDLEISVLVGSEWKPISVIQENQELFYKPSIHEELDMQQKENLLKQKKLLQEKYGEFALAMIKEANQAQKFQLRKEMEDIEKQLADIDQQL